jgi:hypothetical protein
MVYVEQFVCSVAEFVENFGAFYGTRTTGLYTEPHEYGLLSHNLFLKVPFLYYPLICFRPSD